MKLRIIISVILVMAFSTLKAVENEYKYNSILDAIYGGEYDLAYERIDRYYQRSKNKDKTLIVLKELFSKNPEILQASDELFAAEEYEYLIDKYSGNRERVRNITAYKINVLKIFDPKRGAQAEKQYVEFFGAKLDSVIAEISKKRVLRNAKVKKLIQAQQKSRIHSYTAKGNLQAKNKILCVDTGDLTSSHTPADIFTGISDCIKKDDAYHAARLFAVAMTYGYYDKIRMIDKSARQAINALRLIHLSGISKEFLAKLNKEIKNHSYRSTDGKDFRSLCNSIQNLGMPSYHPTYMIKHGMAAFTGRASGVLLDFDEEEGWDKAINNFIKCP